MYIISFTESEITLQWQLLNINQLNIEVDNSFLKALAEFTRSIWPLLASVLSLNVHDCSRMQTSENPGLLALQCWRERNVPTFGELLNVFTAPILHPSFYQFTYVRGSIPVPQHDKNIHSQHTKLYADKLANAFPHSVQDNPSKLV